MTKMRTIYTHVNILKCVNEKNATLLNVGSLPQKPNTMQNKQSQRTKDSKAFEQS